MNTVVLLGDEGLAAEALALANSWKMDPKHQLDAERYSTLIGRDLGESAPFRAPHHSVSEAGLLGQVVDRWWLKPGEISLAHGGTLFLDSGQELMVELLDKIIIAHCEQSYLLESGSAALVLPCSFHLIVGFPLDYPRQVLARIFGGAVHAREKQKGQKWQRVIL